MKFKVGDIVTRKNFNQCMYNKKAKIKELLVNGYKLEEAESGFSIIGTWYDEELELVNNEKVAVQCDTLEEWKAVLDKLFAGGKRWKSGVMEYRECVFEDGRNVIDIDWEPGIAAEDKQWYIDDGGFKIISANEFLGTVKEKNVFVLDAYRARKEFAIYNTKVDSLLEPSGKVITNKKIKINKIMSKVVEFAKNLTLSSDEKLLREVGLKDSFGNFTEDARQISLNLEAVELGHKSFEHLCINVGCALIPTAIEYARLLKKYESNLLDIAKKMVENDKK